MSANPLRVLLAALCVAFAFTFASCDDAPTPFEGESMELDADARRYCPHGPDANYVHHNPDKCATILFTCEPGTVSFSNGCGCGCQPEPMFCGGIAGIQCPTGLTCIDDPTDRCDPDCGGADCGGICVEVEGSQCDGFAGFQCETGLQCFDSKGDGCSLACGGADCGGICASYP